MGTRTPMEELHRRRRSFLAFVRRRVASEALAEDLLQLGLLRASERIHQLRDQDRAVEWFFQVLRRLILDTKQASDRERQALDAVRAELGETVDDAEASFCACSFGLLARLRPEYAQIVRLVDIDDKSVAEAASTLGITTNNAHVRLHRARSALRDELAAACGTLTLRSCLDCACDL